MTERVRSASTVGPHSPKMENDLSPRKTMLVLVIVVGCFAVLWPKVFYPMLVGSSNQHIKPSPIDKTTGCCDVISETDVNTIKIMSELCGTIINATEDRPLTGREIIQRCRQEVLETCGIDISVVLQEQVRLGQNVKQILDEIRSLNGSLCLKYNYGVAPWRLGVPHRVTVKTASDSPYLRQERPLHLRSELVHPAFRERGRAIPQPQPAAPSRPPPRVVEGRPGPIPGMRPTIGGAGHVVPPSKQGTSSMSVIMPIYTIGIVIFFTYTLMKIIFKKQPEGVGGSLYAPVEPDPHFRKEVFESEASRLGPKLTRENISSKLVVNAMSALLDEVDQEIEARRKSSEITSQDLVNGTLSNGDAVKPQDEEQPTVKVLGMEMTASCEGGKKWSRPESPVVPTSPPPPAEPLPPPQEIYLEGALPAQSQLLVAESATEPEPTTGEDPAVVLSGKMTLSVISLDSENGIEEAATGDKILEKEPNGVSEEIEIDNEQSVIEAITEPEERPVTIDEEIQKIIDNIEEEVKESCVELEDENIEPSILDKDIQDFLQKLKEQNEIQMPMITLESEDQPHTVEVDLIEKEVDELIQEALENIQERDAITEVTPILSQQTNEINDNLLNLEDKEITETNELPETKTYSTNLQTLNDVNEQSSKFQLKEELSNEIEKLIQEVKDLPIIEQKTEIPEKSEEDEVEVQISEVTAQANQIETDFVEKTPSFPSPPLESTENVGDTKIEPVLHIESNAAQNTDETKPNENVQKIEEIVTASSKEEPIILSNDKSPLIEATEKVEPTADAKLNEAVAVIEEKPQPAKEVRPLSSQSNESNDDELGSDEEVVEEIEEIVYEEESAEEEVEEEEIEIEVEEEESDEEIPNERNNTNRTESSTVQRINGERSEDLVEESKYTTVSGATAAENDISDEELTDNEEVEEEEEIIEFEEEEIEDEDYINEDNDVNHVSEESDAEL